MKNYRKQIVGIFFTVILLVAFVIVFLAYIRVRLMQEQVVDKTTNGFSQRYALICQDRDSLFWQDIYAGAAERGESTGAYVDFIGEGITQNYSTQQLFDIAINSGYSGIIIEGEDSESQTELIDEASGRHIPVITLINDNYGSERVSFVGIGNYNLGREYARQLIKHVNKNAKRVVLIADKKDDEMSKNLFLNGFNHALETEGNHLELVAEMLQLDVSDRLEIQDEMKKLMTAEELPDVIICLDEESTTSAYQSVVDYNLVGQVKIIGYYISDTTINAISKGVVDATIVLDAKAMGGSAVEALNDYNTYGRVSDYITIDADVVNKANIKEYTDYEKEN